MIAVRSVLLFLLPLVAFPLGAHATRRKPAGRRTRPPQPVRKHAVSEKFRFETFDTKANKISGAPFNATLQHYLRHFGLLESAQFAAQPINVTSWRPIFVTSSSSNHFNELKAMVLTVHMTQPSASIVVYDLGLTKNEISEIRSWCKVTYRKFDFSRYPPHVKQLKKYAWKFLVIAEELVRQRSFFYVDTSIRPHFGDLAAFPRDVRSGMIESFFLFSANIHSIYAATHPGMYRYFPLSGWIGKQLEMLQAGLMFVQDSPYTRRVLKWTTLCSLTESCIAPQGAQLSCEYYRNVFLDYMNCHRYDQSMVNLIVSNLLFNERRIFKVIGSRSLAALKQGKPLKPLNQPQLKDAVEKWKTRARDYDQHFSVLRDTQHFGPIQSCPNDVETEAFSKDELPFY